VKTLDPLRSLKLECEKLVSEKTEMQRHYVMVSCPVPVPPASPKPPLTATSGGVSGRSSAQPHAHPCPGMPGVGLGGAWVRKGLIAIPSNGRLCC